MTHPAQPSGATPLPGLELGYPAAPPSRSGFQVEPEEARSILRPSRDRSIGCDFTLNPYRGCGHACAYCYMREYPHPQHGPEDWGTWVAPKLNAPELLWRERHRARGCRIFLAAATDPYQPLEARLGLTRQCLEILLRATDAEVLLHTRSPLVLRDLDLLTAFGDRISVSFSLSTDDEAIRRIAEPLAPSLESRWTALERLAQAGIRTGLSLAPLLPIHDPGALARRAREAGIRSAWVGRLRLLPEDPFREILLQRGWRFALAKAYRDEVERILLKEFDQAHSRRRRARGIYRAAPLPEALLEPEGLFGSPEPPPDLIPGPKILPGPFRVRKPRVGASPQAFAAG